jgi:hypothetical protein
MDFARLTLLLILLPRFISMIDERQQKEIELRSWLLSDYDKTVRSDFVVEAKFILFLKQIISIDEKNQIMTSSSNCYVYVIKTMNYCFFCFFCHLYIFVFSKWWDSRLSWQEMSNYSNISFILIPGKKRSILLLELF